MSTEESTATTEAVPTRLVSREFVILATSTMLFFAAMGATSPILPQFLTDELGASESVVGLVMGSFAVSSLLARAFVGRLGDRRGARLLMLIGCALGLVASVGYVVVDSIVTAIVARMIFGAGQACVMTGSQTLALDLAPPHRRGEVSSYILVAFHLGLGLGPLLGEFVLLRSDYDSVWWTLALLMVLGFIVAALLPHRPGAPDSEPGPLLHPSGLLPGFVVAFGIVAFVAFAIFVPLYAREIDVDRIGPIFMATSITIAAVRLLGGRLPDILGPIRGGGTALVLLAGGAFVVAGVPSATGLYVGAVILSAGMALQMPSLIPAAILDVKPHQRASAMATFTMFIDLSVALTGPIFGLIVAGASYRTAFAFGGVSAIGALVLLLTLLAPRWNAAQEQSAGSAVQ